MAAAAAVDAVDDRIGSVGRHGPTVAPVVTERTGAGRCARAPPVSTRSLTIGRQRSGCGGPRARVRCASLRYRRRPCGWWRARPRAGGFGPRPGRATRPTSDRVREAIFDMLASLGAVERGQRGRPVRRQRRARHRGAVPGRRRATFVDQDRAAVACHPGQSGRVRLRPDRADGGAATTSSDGSTAAAGPPVDLVLADPPYAFAGWDALLAGLAAVAGLAVLESGAPAGARPRVASSQAEAVRRYRGDGHPAGTSRRSGKRTRKGGM